jgi:CheY-like chemotaxis protein
MSRTLKLVADAPTRVLLVGTDRRFRRLAAALLRGRGHEVIPADPGPLADAVRRAHAEIVVIDGDDDHVVVSEAPDLMGARTRILPKWGSFDEIAEAVEELRGSRRD